MSTWAALPTFTAASAMTNTNMAAMTGNALYLGDATDGRPGACARNWQVTASTVWQTVNGSAATDIAWDCKDVFTTGATHRFTIPTNETGWYLMTIDAHLENPGSTAWLRAGIAKNGGSSFWCLVGHSDTTSGAATYAGLSVSAMTLVRFTAAADYGVAKVAASVANIVRVNWSFTKMAVL